MRKIALSLAALAVLFVTAAQAKEESWRNGNTRMSNQQGSGIRSQERPDWELGITPVLAHHLQQAPATESLGAGTDSEAESWMTRKDAKCDIGLTVAQDNKKMGPNSYSCIKGHDADCQINDWGCNNKYNYVNKPSAKNVVGVENVLMATVVPAQILTSNQTSIT